MATISIASAKGGCGKTTLAILLGTELALEGYKVALLDCDVNQHATAFGKKAAIPGFAVAPSIDEGNVLPELRKANADADVVLIDLPGGSSTLALKALQRTNYVLVPSGTSGARQPAYNVHSSLHQRRLASVLLWRPFGSRFPSTWTMS